MPGEADLAQIDFLGGLLRGPRDAEGWHGKQTDVDFYDLKGDVERLLAWRGAEPEPFQFAPRTDDPALHPGQAASVCIGSREIGRLGRLHPELEERLEIGPVFVFELQADAVLQRPARRYAEISRYPSVRRDLALLVDRNVAAADLQACVVQGPW